MLYNNTMARDYKRFLSMSRCSTRNLCPEMTLLHICCSTLSLTFGLNRDFLFLYSIGLMSYFLLMYQPNMVSCYVAFVQKLTNDTIFGDPFTHC